MPEARSCAKETILRLFEEQKMTCLDDSSLSRLHALAVSSLPGSRISRSYVLRVIDNAGKPVKVRDPFSGAGLAEPYKSELAKVLKFDTLENAEETLRILSEKLAAYQSRSDRQGASAVRAVAMLGKRRAAASARRVRDPLARQRKTEIAEWFTLWLYDPGTFPDWLLLRKRSPEFRERFGATC
ncbi:MAG: hypothetical protein HY650_09925 [Acidobacteria bacterium]|nr:hypothetical protein [Acidobacteriota bacterium]